MVLMTRGVGDRAKRPEPKKVKAYCKGHITSRPQWKGQSCNRTALLPWNPKTNSTMPALWFCWQHKSQARGRKAR